MRPWGSALSGPSTAIMRLRARSGPSRGMTSTAAKTGTMTSETHRAMSRAYAGSTMTAQASDTSQQQNITAVPTAKRRQSIRLTAR